MVVSVYAVTLAPTEKVVNPALKPLLVARCTLKPVSLFELSVQDRLTVVAFAATADSPEGALGSVTVAAGVVTVAVFDIGELPDAFEAKMR